MEKCFKLIQMTRDRYHWIGNLISSWMVYAPLYFLHLLRNNSGETGKIFKTYRISSRLVSLDRKFNFESNGMSNFIIPSHITELKLKKL